MLIRSFGFQKYKDTFASSNLKLACALAFVVVSASVAWAQAPDFDPTWYDASLTYVKLEVVEDGIHEVSGSELSSAGVSLAAIDPVTLKLFENGEEIPIAFIGDDASMDPTDRIQFLGKRNTGADEAWAYYETTTSESQTPGDALQSSQEYSLFTDTTYYWLAWTGQPGLRYSDEPVTPEPGADDISFVLQTHHTELDFSRYDGDSIDNGHPYYTHGEGDYWRTFLQNSIRRDSVIMGVRSGPHSGFIWSDAVVEARVVPGSAAHHDVILKVRVWGGQDGIYVPMDEVQWTGYEFQTLTASVTQDQIYTFNGTVYVEIVSDNQFYDGHTPNRVYTDWVRVTLRGDLKATDDVLTFPSNGVANYAYQLASFSPGTITVLEPASGQRFVGTADAAGDFTFGDSDNGNTLYWAAHSSAIHSPAAITLEQNSDWANTANAADYVIITAPAMRSSAQAVADFHTARNGYSVVIAEIQNIFDQFDYGRRTPIAIRRFLQTTQTWSTPPRFVLLWGDARYADPQTEFAPWEVPTYGFSSSDNWFVQGLGGKYDLQEFMAIGRVTIRNSSDAQIFLNKLQNYYDSPFSDWQQRLYYLTGGTDADQATFQAHSRNWAGIAAGEPAGMDTSFFFKTSESTLDTSLRDSIRVAIQRGSSLLSYFGHSSSQTWEIVTDPASEFDNPDRLPLVISFGCRTGAFAAGLDPVVDVRSLSEDLLIDSESGAIGHWGTSELGTVGNSAALAVLFHQVVFEDTSRTLGLVIQEVKNRFAASYSSYWAKRHSLQYNLIGDPGIILALPDKPDLHIDQPLVRFEPLIPITADSTVTVTLDLRNRGYYTADSVSVTLLHTLPDDSTEVFNVRIPKFAIADTLIFSTTIDDQPGLHTYAISVDPGNEYDEMREDNNSITLTHLVFSNGLTVVSPEKYGITTRTPKLRVSIATQIEMGEVPVHYELDTVPTFDSPNLTTFSSIIANAHADWRVTTALDDRTVYYWRATADNPSDPDATWAEASFTVSTADASSYTWMQQDALWLDDVNNRSLMWAEGTGWEFVPYTVSVFAHADRSSQSPLSGRFHVNGESYLLNAVGIGVLVLDGEIGTVKAYAFAVPYSNPFDCCQNYNAEVQRLQNVADSIEPGDYFFIRTRNLAIQGSNIITEEVKDIFRELGSIAIDTLTYSHIWLMKGRLGDPSETEEMVSPPEEAEEVEELSWTHKFVFSNPSGETTSPPIGPSQSWDELIGQIEHANSESEIVVDVLSENGDVELMTGVDITTSVDLSAISASEHPYLRLRATLTDTTQQSTPQLENWRISYTPIPDLVVDASSSSFPTEVLQEGEPAAVSLVVRNLSETPVGVAHLTVQLTDDENSASTLLTESIKGIPADGAHTLSFDIPTLDYVGNNLLLVQAEQPDLPERIVYNNAILRSYDVEVDRIRPVMVVTVDGEMFENAPGPVLDLQSAELPFVSARPEIEIVVSDENPYLRLDDPASFQLALDRLPLTPEQFTFTPATDELNEARIVFAPDLTGVDTVHTFTVRAVDATGNPALVDATAEDSTLYQVHFRVQNALIIESLYPYPNPMSRNTRLMFRMGGASASIVDDFRIRIYSVAGRLVREFDLIRNPELLERGGLQIGWNSVPWDGTDEDGDPVASGVYLYKVFVRDIDGEEHAINNPTSIERIAVIR